MKLLAWKKDQIIRTPIGDVPYGTYVCVWNAESPKRPELPLVGYLPDEEFPYRVVAASDIGFFNRGKAFVTVRFDRAKLIPKTEAS